MAPLGGAQLLLDHDDNVRFALGLQRATESCGQLEAAAQRPNGPASSSQDSATRAWCRSRFSADNRSVYLTGVREGESLDSAVSPGSADAAGREGVRVRERQRRLASSPTSPISTSSASAAMASSRPISGCSRTIPSLRRTRRCNAHSRSSVSTVTSNERRRSARDRVRRLGRQPRRLLSVRHRQQARRIPARRAHLDRTQADASEGADSRSRRATACSCTVT